MNDVQKIQKEADLTLKKNQWVCTFEIENEHKGAVLRVCWADPEFGSIIASCGNDQQVIVFKEKEVSDQKPRMMQKNKKDTVNIKTSWEQIWLNNNSNQQVRDIKFAPKFNGLVLSVACADGVVKFYSP